MGVTFYPAGNQAETYDQAFHSVGSILDRNYSKLHGSKSILPSDVFGSSFSKDEKRKLVGVNNGFVQAVLEAYEHHRILVIKPDDVWIAILSQFNFFVNRNAEALRDSFVEHKGKKLLRFPISVPSRYRIDVATAAASLTQLVQENVTDPSVRDWILPNFSTTTPVDTAVAAILMMATFQQYFAYMVGGCGIPAVTLEGEKKDWEGILRRIEKLKEYGLQTTAWYHLLRPVIKRFVAAFDDPNGAANLDFWNRVAHQGPLMSGYQKLTGWITAFCVFEKEGGWTGPKFKDEFYRVIAKQHPSADLSPPEFAEKYLSTERRGTEDEEDPALVLDGVRYHTVCSVPPSVGGVDITIVEDNGQSYNAALLAGLPAYELVSSGDTVHSVTGAMDTVRPVAGWWLFEKPPRGARDRDQYIGL